jgi:hypothetical protein
VCLHLRFLLYSKIYNNDVLVSYIILIVVTNIILYLGTFFHARNGHNVCPTYKSALVVILYLCMDLLVIKILKLHSIFNMMPGIMITWLCTKANNTKEK